MKERPLVSVIIPTYNKEKIIINRTVPSVLRQTYKNVEIVIVMDDSPKQTKEALEIAYRHDDRMRLHYLRKPSPYPNIPNKRFITGVPPRNMGLQLARGDLIAPLDDDDEFYANHLEIAVKAHRRTGCDFSYALTEDIHEETGESLGICGAAPSAKRMIVPHCTWVYSAKLKNEKYSMEGKEPGDKDLWMRFRNSKYKFEFIDIVTARHYTNQKSPPPPDWY